MAFSSVTSILEKLDSGRMVWKFGLWTPVRFDPGCLDFAQLNGWALDAWTLDTWKLGLWTPGSLDAWNLGGWTLDA